MSDELEWEAHEHDCGWARELEEHLRQFQPQVYAGLKKEGRLKAYCQSQAASTHRMSLSLFNQGLSALEAQEKAKATYIYPSEVSDDLW